MADVKIGMMRTAVEVTDTDALLHPQVMAKIVAAVEARIAAKANEDITRAAETRIGKRREQG